MTVTETVQDTIEVTKALNQITSSNLAFAKEALQITANVGEAITPFVPLIGAAAAIITEIIDIYHTSQYNKKICNSLLDRARLAEIAIDQLIRRRNENDKQFKNKTWYKAFDRFVLVLGKIRTFAKQITHLQGITRFIQAKNIADRFKDLTTEYDNAMKDLNFTMIIASERQRQIDHESVKNDLSEINKFLEKIHCGTEENNVKIALIFDQVKSIKSMIAKSEDGEAKSLDTSKLTAPMVGRKGDTRGSRKPFLKRRMYMDAVEVACKPIKVPGRDTKEYEQVQRHFSVLIKATQSPNIIQFYGLSNVDGEPVMVLEWAQLGDLRELYRSVKIPLELKLTYALQICRGIAYLNALDIYHHDLRCKNVVVTESHVAKLTNFEFSREQNATSISFNSRAERIRWFAPEKLKDDEYYYDHKCEIFSFGMLLWELAFERVPYENMEIDKFSEFVINGGREAIRFGLASPEIANIQKDFEKIIREAWRQDPDARISISKLLIDLDTLTNSFVKPGCSPSLQPQEDIVNFDEIPEYQDEFDIDLLDEALESLIPISDGIKAHAAQDYEKAWKCFEGQSENQNSVGKYWKAYYLWEGFFIQQDKINALTLFKEAADDGIVDAQYRYAIGLLDKDLKSKLKISSKEAVKYLRLAADNGSGPAQFQMGEAYSKGRLGYKINDELAILWYKRAAIQNDKKARKKLGELNVNIDLFILNSV